MNIEEIENKVSNIKNIYRELYEEVEFLLETLKKKDSRYDDCRKYSACMLHFIQNNKYILELDTSVKKLSLEINKENLNKIAEIKVGLKE